MDYYGFEFLSSFGIVARTNGNNERSAGRAHSRDSEWCACNHVFIIIRYGVHAYEFRHLVLRSPLPVTQCARFMGPARKLTLTHSITATRKSRNVRDSHLTAYHLRQYVCVLLCHARALSTFPKWKMKNPIDLFHLKYMSSSRSHINSLWFTFYSLALSHSWRAVAHVTRSWFFHAVRTVNWMHTVPLFRLDLPNRIHCVWLLIFLRSFRLFEVEMRPNGRRMQRRHFHFEHKICHK